MKNITDHKWYPYIFWIIIFLVIAIFLGIYEPALLIIIVGAIYGYLIAVDYYKTLLKDVNYELYKEKLLSKYFYSLTHDQKQILETEFIDNIILNDKFTYRIYKKEGLESVLPSYHNFVLDKLGVLSEIAYEVSLK